MDLLWWLRPFLAVNDPVFGRLVRQGRGGRWWAGKIQLPNVVGAVAVRVRCSKAGPSEAQRRRFAELVERFEEIRRLMAPFLFKGYNEHVAECLLDAPSEAHAFPLLPSVEEVWAVVSLRSIEVYNWAGSGAIDFSFNHRVHWPDVEHGLNASMKDWKEIEVIVE